MIKLLTLTCGCLKFKLTNRFLVNKRCFYKDIENPKILVVSQNAKASRASSYAFEEVISEQKNTILFLLWLFKVLSNKYYKFLVRSNFPC